MITEDWTGLLAHGQKWTRADPENAGTWFILGLAQDELSQPLQAIAAYQHALYLDSRDTTTLNNLGKSYSTVQDYSRVIGTFQKALDIDPQNPNTRYNLGNVLLGTHRYEEAIHQYRLAIQFQPANALVWYNLDNAYKMTHDTTGLQEVYVKLQMLSPAYADKLIAQNIH